MEHDRNTMDQKAPEEKNGCCPKPLNAISAPLKNHPDLQFGASSEFQALLAANMVDIRGGFSEMVRPSIFRHELCEKACLNIIKARHEVSCFPPIITTSPKYQGRISRCPMANIFLDAFCT